jgi:hypothetical protein
MGGDAMIHPPGCELVSVLHEDCLRDARTNPTYTKLVERLCDAPALRSTMWGSAWGEPPSNSIQKSLLKADIAESLRIGIAMSLLEARLHTHRKVLYLFIEGHQLVRITEHLLEFGIDFGGPLELGEPDASLLREAVLDRGKNRIRWFGYFTPDWRLRPIEEHPIQDGIKSARASKKQNELAALEGASLCISHDPRLFAALDFIKKHPFPVRREDLKAEFQMGTAQLDVLMTQLRTIGTPNLAPPHRMKGSKDIH